MAEIRLSDGSTVLVDDIDFQRFGHLKWQPSGTGYASRRVGRRSEKRTTVYLHRAIMCAPEGVEVDHINRIRSDCRRENLRLVTRTENARNKTPHSDANSKFKGVHWNARKKTWRAEISPNRKRIHLGNFKTEEQAARAYDAAAREHFGEFAFVNFPDEAQREGQFQ